MQADWTRVIWANARAREVWEPRIQAISKAWLEIEIASVCTRLRDAALVFGPVQWALPSIEVAENRYAVGPRASDLATAYRIHDNDWMGILLGFPECCRVFFDRHQPGSNIDTTWEMAGEVDVSGHRECNLLGRWLGVRLVSHLPCSFQCGPTLNLAKTWAALWPQRELAWTREILSWPVEWSAVHGIAEVKFPILKLSTRTSVYPEKKVVRQQGTSYPSEGACGTVFPYKQSVHHALHFTKASDWQDNGFSSADVMNKAHEMVLGALRASPPYGDVADLGAGNGRLIDLIKREFPDDYVGGVDIDPKRAKDHPFIHIGDLRELLKSRSTFDTLIVSQRRFEEIPTLEEWCRSHARQVLVYSYDEPMFARMES